MKIRKLEKSGLEVLVLGFGCTELGFGCDAVTEKQEANKLIIKA